MNQMYDILPPNRFPYEPGATAWIILAALLLAALLLLCWLQRRRRTRDVPRKVLESLRATLERISAKNLSEQSALKASTAQITHLVRRGLWAMQSEDLSGVTGAALKIRAQAVSDPALAALLLATATLEELSYAPEISESKFHEVLRAALESVQKILARPGLTPEGT